MALWATWGSCFISKGGCQYTQPLFNTSDDGWQWGRFIGRRFGERSNLVFVLGGDISEPVQPLSHTMVYRGALLLQRVCHVWPPSNILALLHEFQISSTSSSDQLRRLAPVLSVRISGMAEGIAQGVAEGSNGSRPSHRPRYNDSTDPLWRQQLMTLHPGGAHSSSEVFGNDAWLSFNLIQSGWRSQAVRLCRKRQLLPNSLQSCARDL